MRVARRQVRHLERANLFPPRAEVRFRCWPAKGEQSATCAGAEVIAESEGLARVPHLLAG